MAVLVQLAALAVVVGALHLARPVLLPLAVAVLLSFVIAPLVRRADRAGLGDAGAVLVVTLGVGALLLGTGWVVGSQGGALAERLPEYRYNVEVKLQSLRASLQQVQQAARRVQEIEREIGEDESGPAREKPTPVELVDDDGLLGLVGGYLGSVVAPLAKIGIVLVLLLFMLFQREDLRDRLLRVLGSRDLHLTTVAMDDAAQRVSRYLRAYSLLNGGHGLVVGVGLWLFGLPAPILFGLLSALLRFVPYLGPWIAATLPVALSVAVFDGWGVTLGIVGFLVAVELVSNNLVEPWLYGASVGLSPFAVILSAIFWAWVWGPVGLVLSTPLTVCLVVMGRHLPRLEFVAVLLGDEPAFDESTHLYQRWLAGDLDEANDIVAEYAERRGTPASWDELVLPALALLEREHEQGRFDEEPDFARDAFEGLAASLPPAPDEAERPESIPAAGVLCLPARASGDEIVCRLLAEALERDGLGVRVSRRVLLGEMAELAVAEDVGVVCVSAISEEGRRTLRHLTQRILARRSDVEIVLGLWGAPRERVDALRGRLDAERTVRIVTSMSEARQTLRWLAHARGRAARSSEAGPSEARTA